MRRGWMIAALTLLGCEASTLGLLPPSMSSDPGPEPPTPGRLRPRYWASAGARTFKDWFDTKLQTPCSFERAPDGAYYCLPLGPTTSNYRDSACLEPVLDVSCRDEAPRFARVEQRVASSDPCRFADQARRAFRVGPEVTLSSTYSSFAGCAWLGASPGPTFRALGPELLPTQLVKAELLREPRGDRLVQEVLVAADGAREPRAIIDPRLAGPCTALYNGAECLPLSNTVAIDDGACLETQNQRPVAFQSSSICPPVAVVALRPDPEQACAVLQSYHQVGAEVAAESVVGGGLNQGCGPFGGERYFEPGPALLASPFAPLSRVRVGSGRLQVEHLETPEGLPLGASLQPFFDAQLNRYCRLITLDEDRRLCLSVGEPWEPVDLTSGYYLDPSCTVPAALVQVRIDGCSEAPPYLVRARIDPTCGGRRDWELRPILAPLNGPGFVLEEGRCAPVEGLLSRPEWRAELRAVGDPIDPAEWPVLQVVQD